jgi:ATP-dependent DNA helicase PIF1
LRSFCLKQVFRQRDEAFIACLNDLRVGKGGTDAVRRIMDVAKAVPAFVPSAGKVVPTRLYPGNDDVSRMNRTELRTCPGGPLGSPDYGSDLGFQLRADDYANNALGDRAKNMMKTLAESCPAEAVLCLKVGAQVMLLKNKDASQGLVNGARGMVVEFVTQELEMVPGATSVDDESEVTQWALSTGAAVKNKSGDGQRVGGTHVILPRCRFSLPDGTHVDHTVQPEKWSMEEGLVTCCSRMAVPLKLAWAITIHKSQVALLVLPFASATRRALNAIALYMALSAHHQ